MINPPTHYQLTLDQVNNLFTDKIDHKSFNVLCISAENGNLDSIDILHNIALRQDDVGKQAENMLFDLFSGKKSGKQGVDSDIQKASLALYHLSHNNKTINNKDMQKLREPSKLLYITGSALSNATEKKLLSTKLMDNQISQSPHEQLNEVDIWERNRMLQTDEINAATKKIAHDTPDISINFPLGITPPHDNMLNEIIKEKQQGKNTINQLELFPINTGNHWVLFILYKDPSDNKMKNIVFNSYYELNKDIKESLKETAKIAGLTEESDTTFIEGNIQDNVPNGCGLFVVKAIELACQTPKHNLVDKLKLFTEEFMKRSIEEQILFNIQTRRQLYEEYYDDIYKAKETERQ